MFRKAKEIKDDVWAEKRNKKSYIARAIINRANDLCHAELGFEPLTDNILASTPAQAMDAAILIKELYDKLSSTEQTLLEHVFLGYSGVEIANKLGTSCPTARKRISRLMGKLSLLSQGKENTAFSGARARMC